LCGLSWECPDKGAPREGRTKVPPPLASFGAPSSDEEIGRDVEVCHYPPSSPSRLSFYQGYTSTLLPAAQRFQRSFGTNRLEIEEATTFGDSCTSYCLVRADSVIRTRRPVVQGDACILVRQSPGDDVVNVWGRQDPHHLPRQRCPIKDYPLGATPSAVASKAAFPCREARAQ